MAHKYAQIVFTPTVRGVQEQQNSRTGYASMDAGEDCNFMLSDREKDFLEQRDSFYMASVSETNWPYVQHRGGPKGFVKVIDESTIGFSDFRGNRQYVSTGNFRSNDRVALIFMDYANRRRLKIMGRVTQVSDQDWELLAKLEAEDYPAAAERGFLIHVEAFDWNCPQHITPRFTQEELNNSITSILRENELLKSRQTTLAAEPLGEGPLALVISSIRQLTPRVRSYELRSLNGEDLPVIPAGSHLQIPLPLAGDEHAWRSYSICSDPQRRDLYEIAVLDTGKGGSHAIHQSFNLGQTLFCKMPANHFQLHEDGRPAVLIAAGIGITPLKSMAHTLASRRANWHLHYAGRSLNEMAFRDSLLEHFPKQVSLYHKDGPERLDIEEILGNAPIDAQFYVCGPNRLIEEVITIARKLGLDSSRIAHERFISEVHGAAEPMTVFLAKSNISLAVPTNQSILNAALEAGITANYSCRAGQCKTCAVKVLEGKAKHHDQCLDSRERNEQQLMCPCVSRGESGNLVLDM
ncbi:MAG: pyridoxamine 5'-phosphate oxidase family protein [Pseudohongiellaceae bacterium]